jgi:predicted lipase
LAGGFGYAADLGDGEAVLALRGTQVFKPGDPPAKFRAIARDYLTNARLGRHRDPDGCSVHGGFHRSAGELFDALAATGWLGSPRRWLVTGHSLGGALAVLLAERIASAQPGSVAGVLTLGQPRVGNRRHVERLQALPFPILRIVHGCDVIPSVPPESLDYAHLASEQVFAIDRRRDYAATVLQNVFGLWSAWRHGIGALSPVGLQDHAPLTYAVHCYNAFEGEPAP